MRAVSFLNADRGMPERLVIASGGNDTPGMAFSRVSSAWRRFSGYVNRIIGIFLFAVFAYIIVVSIVAVAFRGATSVDEIITMLLCECQFVRARRLWCGVMPLAAKHRIISTSRFTHSQNKSRSDESIGACAAAA